ncbi:hypothetical protein H0H81_006518 [Sphagnurus paluster]|uniref:F-box domain-containing protein n=1 Tax=Sphagnurus paluster TaxID=117069 RepID=A0A9P7GRU4_9AGAR|nr:hypothetical protein H0H81_006518 [Sphagnurus paluster]
MISQATISHLPNELLLAIFSVIYLESTNSFSIYPELDTDEQEEPHTPDSDSDSDISEPERSFWYGDDDVRSASLFPYNIAGVCKTWQNLLSGVAAYWTRIVILTDVPAQFPSAVAKYKYLEWSKGLPLFVTISQRDPDSFLGETGAAVERARVKEALTLVLPELPRTLTLEVAVTHTSSLPRVLTDIPDSGARLKHLTLKFPTLCKLHLDGWNFVDIVRNQPEWFSDILASDDRRLTLKVSNYRPTPGGVHGEGAFPALAAFPVLHGFDTVALDDLEFECGPTKVTGKPERDGCSGGDGDDDDDDGGWESESDTSDSDIELIGDYVKLISLSPTLLAFLIPHINVECLSISKCNLGLVQAFPEDSILELGHLDYPTLAADLRRLLPAWAGSELFISHCPGFDDSVLRMLGSVQRPETGAGRGQVELNAPDMEVLSLSSCKGFSIRALKAMVHARQAVDESQLGFEISMDDGPRVSQKDIKWFVRRLQMFELDGDTGDEDY